MQTLINLIIGFVLALIFAPITILAFLFIVQSAYVQRAQNLYDEQMRRIEQEYRE